MVLWERGALCEALLHGFLSQAGLPRDRIFLSSRGSSRLRKVAERFFSPGRFREMRNWLTVLKWFFCV